MCLADVAQVLVGGVRSALGRASSIGELGRRVGKETR
jgi:hypothetical protein